MTVVTPIRSPAEAYLAMPDTEIGRIASGGYGPKRFKEFVAEFREVCRLAKLAERAIVDGVIR
jgi:hypothetical protein